MTTEVDFEAAAAAVGELVTLKDTYILEEELPMTRLVARTFLGKNWRDEPALGVIWVGIYDDTGEQLAAIKAQTDNLYGEAFVAALVAAAAGLGYTATSPVRIVGDECDFAVEPTAIPHDETDETDRTERAEMAELQDRGGYAQYDIHVVAVGVDDHPVVVPL